MSSVKHIFVSSRFLLSPTCFDIRKQHCEILVGALRLSHYLYIIHNRATGEVSFVYGFTFYSDRCNTIRALYKINKIYDLAECRSVMIKIGKRLAAGIEGISL